MSSDQSRNTHMLSEDNVCTVCQTNEHKYKCPACGMKTCSLACVTRHKKQTECTGVVDQTKFIPKNELTEDSGYINRDYNFLLNFGRNIQLSKTDIKSNAKNIFKRQYNNNYNNNNNRNSKRFKANSEQEEDQRIAIVNNAYSNNPPTSIKRNNTLVIQLPQGMSRSSSNKSGYDKKLQSFTWTVEWVLIDTNGDIKKTFLSYRLKEHLSLKDAVPMNILNNTIPEEEEGNNRIEKNQLSFYLENVVNFNKPNKSIIQISPEDLISVALKDKIVLEFPTIYITLNKDTWNNFVHEESVAYGLNMQKEVSDDSESNTTSSDDSDDSDSSGSEGDDSLDDELPEESSSKEPQKIVFKDEELNNKDEELNNNVEVSHKADEASDIPKESTSLIA